MRPSPAREGHAEQCSINVSQVLGAPLALFNPELHNQWISFTKQQFAVLTMNMTQRWAPTVVRVSGDKSVRGQLFQTTGDDLLCLFPKRMIMIANHQIYTDWLYLWWIAYSNGMHGRIYIILKESLKRIPVIGWGMQLCQFIFLKRDWEQDKPQMADHMKKLDNIEDPMWLLLFPEGTNLAPSTRDTSARWAAKNGIKDMQHTLLPRTTGLQFCLQELRQTVGYVYDCTIAYEGVPRGKYAQDIYTLQASYVDGKPPKCVHMYWRRFPVSSIPIFDDRKFELWLRTRWLEKDGLIEFWHKHGRFPADTGAEKDASGRIRRGAGYIESSIKASKWNDFLHQFMPMGLLAMVLFSFYGALPEIMKNTVKDHPLLKQLSDLPQVNVQGLGQSPKTLRSEPAIAAVAPGSQVLNAQAKAAQLAAARTKKPTQPLMKHQLKGSAATPGSATARKSATTPAQESATAPAQKLVQAQKPRAAPKLGPKGPSSSAMTAEAASQSDAKSDGDIRFNSANGSAARPKVLKLGSRAASVAGSSLGSIAAGAAPKLSPRANGQTASARPAMKLDSTNAGRRDPSTPAKEVKIKEASHAKA